MSTVTAAARDAGIEAHGPTSAEYASARRVWNASIDVRPLAILRPRTAADVGTILAAAAAARTPVAVRGGGHSVRGLAVATGAVCIDLRHVAGGRSAGVVYDADARVVAVSGGATWADVDAVLGPLGLAVPAGLISHTGVGGLALGGGLGWLSRRAGLTIDAIVGATLVLPSGRIVSLPPHAAATPQPADAELWWALKTGFGPAFGVVTRFRFAVTPVALAALALVHLPRTVDALAPALARVVAWIDDAPPAIVPYLFVLSAGVVVVAIAHTDLHRRGSGYDALVPYTDALCALGGVVAELRELSMAELNSAFDAGSPHGKHYRWSASTLLNVDAVAADTRRLAAALIALSDGTAAPLPGAVATSIELVPLRSRNAPAPPVSTGCGLDALRAAAAEVHGIATWEPLGSAAANADADDAAHAWAHGIAAAVAPYAVDPGAPSGYLNTDGEVAATSARVVAAAGAAAPRLATLKAAVDPHNILAFNHGIPTAALPTADELDDALDAILANTRRPPPASRHANLWVVWAVLPIIVVAAIAVVLYLHPL